MDINLIIVVVLLILATLDLTVGVANDAVNFLNSAIGARAATFRTIMIVAAAGVLVGVTFSSGMMEIARKGIFYPEQFVMPELLIIFLAVMYQDILLLDLFNTFGLPTSTTVSIVFGLVGSSLAMASIKIMATHGDMAQIGNYINTESLLGIVSAILLSIIFAFFFGSLTQWITRLLFTFDYKYNFRKYGAIWSGVALTSLSMFIIFKGAKGAVFIPEDTAGWMKSNAMELSVYLLVVWTIIIGIIMKFTKVNVLKIIVLIGTFALAMAFAANDLVNFIGAPLAGLNAYQFANETANPLTASMDVMNQQIIANIWMLLFAGGVMITTLFLSRKAKNVARTTINLGSHDEGMEKFDSNLVGRVIVRIFITASAFVLKLVPKDIKKWVSGRFDLNRYNPPLDENGIPPAFDMLRAAVILMVSAALISFATAQKLPLSTTYVTFIVAMAAALPDKAWGRETAVYRVSGVVTVVGGWFLTAFSAAAVAFTIALILHFTGLFGIVALGGLVAFTFYRTAKYRKEQDIKEESTLARLKKVAGEPDKMLKIIYTDISNYIKEINLTLKNSYNYLADENLSQLKKAHKNSKRLNSEAAILVKNILKMLKYTPENQLDQGFKYTRALSCFPDLSERLKEITKYNYSYIDNNHNPILPVQVEELKQALHKFDEMVQITANNIEGMKFDKLDDIKHLNDEFDAMLNKFTQNQLMRIKESSANYKLSMLYLLIMTDLDKISDNVVKIYKACKDVFLNVNYKD